MKIYKISVLGDRLSVIEQINFKDSFGWLNNDIVVNAVDGDHIYADEYNIGKCSTRLLGHLIKEQLDIIEKANKRLKNLENIIK